MNLLKKIVLVKYISTTKMHPVRHGAYLHQPAGYPGSSRALVSGHMTVSTSMQVYPNHVGGRINCVCLNIRIPSGVKYFW